jgi:hypothetical protein
MAGSLWHMDGLRIDAVWALSSLILYREVKICKVCDIRIYCKEPAEYGSMQYSMP